MSVLSHNKARPGVNQFLSFVFVKFSIPETEQSDVTSWVPLLQRSKFKYPLNHMYPTSKRLEAPALCSSQEAPLPASVGKWPLPTYPMLFFYKQRCTLSLLQWHVVGSDMSPAAAPLSNLDTLKQSLCSISSAAFFSSIEVSYLLPKPDTPSELSLLKNQTVWASKLQPKDALFVVEMCTFLMEKQKHCVLLSRYAPILGFNFNRTLL